MEYKLITDTDSHRLEAAVNEMLAEGWTPVGGPVFVSGRATDSATGVQYLQNVLIQALTIQRPIVMRLGGAAPEERLQPMDFKRADPPDFRRGREGPDP